MRTRDRDAEFKDFYLAEAPRLLRLAIMLTGDPEKAADLSQEALIKVYTKWHRIRNESPGPYARTILVNLCRSAYRRKMLEIRKAPAHSGYIPDQSTHVDDALRVATALSALSPIRRAVVLLRFYEDMPEQQIASVLDRPINTIKSDLRRALETLRPMFGDDIRETR
jgi:RNA polymerase sigma-70 factor (sigma-E family)